MEYKRALELRTKGEDWQDTNSYGKKAETEELWIQAQMKRLIKKEVKKILVYPLKKNRINQWLLKNKEELGWTDRQYWNTLLKEEL